MFSTTTHERSSAHAEGGHAASPSSATEHSAAAPDRPPRRVNGRGWAWAGLAAGILGVGLFIGPASLLAVPTDAYADNADVVAELEGKEEWIWAFQTGSVALAVLIVIFGLGLRRRLAGQEPVGSLLPDAAGLGLLLVAALLLVGGGISTEMFHALRHADESDPDTIGAHLTLFNTLGWVWAGGILATGAVAIAGLRHGSVGKGVAWFAAVMTVLTAATQLVPLQYLAVAPVALFLIACSISMLRAERSTTGTLRLDG